MPRYRTKRQRRANHQPRHTLALRMVQALAAASLTTMRRLLLAAALMTAWGALVGAAASFFYARGMAYPLPVSVLLAVRGFCLAGAASAAVMAIALFSKG